MLSPTTIKEGCDFINQHICLFLASGQLKPEKQREFFYRMCTALGYGRNKMISLSAIYAHYGLFDGKPITEAAADKLERLAPCKSCTALRKKSIYKGIPILEEACPVCIHSPDYCNARQRDEMMVLRYYMGNPSAYEYLQILPEMAFRSRSRLCPDYAIGKHPVIPFHFHLYTYLEEHSLSQLGKEAFFNELLQYISSQVVVLFDVEDYRERLQVLFDSIYKIDGKSISEDIYQKCADHLRMAYTYAPPTEGKPVRTGPSPINGQNEKNHAKKPDQSPNPVNLATHKNETTKGESAPSADSLDMAEAFSIFEEPIDGENSDPGLPSLEKLQKAFDNPSGTAPRQDNPMLHARTNTSSITARQENDNICNTNALPTYKHTEFNNHIINSLEDRFLTADFSRYFEEIIIPIRRHGTFLFCVESSQNHRISVEPVLFHERAGLLFYLQAQDKFYFYDLEILSTEFAISLLQNPSIPCISYSAMYIHSLLEEYGYTDMNIHSIDAMYYAATGKDPIYMDIFSDRLGKPGRIRDCLYYTLPLYGEIYSKLQDKAEQTNQIWQYKRIASIQAVLSSLKRIKEISGKRPPYVTENGYLKFHFSFRWNDPFRKAGQIFR